MPLHAVVYWKFLHYTTSAVTQVHNVGTYRQRTRISGSLSSLIMPNLLSITSRTTIPSNILLISKMSFPPLPVDLLNHHFLKFLAVS